MTLNGPPPKAYASRRAAVLEKLDRSVLFLPGAPEATYSNDVHYPYRPDTYVRYLTGFEEPAAVVLSHTGADEDGFTLFVRPREPLAETWTGERAGIDGARQTYGADFAYPLDETFSVLEKRLASAERLFVGPSLDHSVDERVLEVVHRVNAGRPRAGGEPLMVTDAAALLADMRLIKQAEEINVLRSACRISAEAHVRAMEVLRPGLREYEVQALVEYVLRSGGCAGPAYGTIAAGGSNATVLHYVRNDRTLEAGELLLLDAGGEYGGYCADITRTFPVGPKYSSAQATLYDVVLEAQKSTIALIAPGVTHAQAHDNAVRVLADGLLRLGLLEGDLDSCIESEAYKKYFMHGTGHWLGMDVHDVGSYKTGDASRRLEPGIVLTVEPGLYIRADSEAPAEYRGVGIRIEDDVLVTETGCEVLTRDVPKERGEIEAVRSRAFA